MFEANLFLKVSRVFILIVYDMVEYAEGNHRNGRSNYIIHNLNGGSDDIISLNMDIKRCYA